jgi:hypothetical protein
MLICPELINPREFIEALEKYGELEKNNLSFDPVKCSWGEVLNELLKAQGAVTCREAYEKKFIGKSQRKLTNMTKILQPALEAIPDELCILHGGLAVIFNVRRP